MTLTVFFWGTLVLYGGSSLWWVFEITVLAYDWEADSLTEIGLTDIQVRILTVDSASTVQVSVNSLPEQLDDIKVIAETEIDIDGADVHVPPDDFECQAQRKGRAIEWARRHVPCDREYVLYLDEDTIVINLEGLPAADVIQISEHPLRTGSRLAYLCEVFRIGYQREQRAFHRLAYPLYAWGGAVAVRRDLENKITWDVPTITEDTTFIWRAAKYLDQQDEQLDYQLVNGRFRNQAPPSLSAMINQRRRWLSGTVDDMHRLPRRYLPLQFTRIITWTVSPLIPLLSVVAFLFPGVVPQHNLYQIASTGLFGMLFVYTTAGMLEYRTYPEVGLLHLIITPFTVVIYAVGALWGFLRPVSDFEVTEKTAGQVDVETLSEENPGFSQADVDSSDDTESVVESDSANK
ncbi:MAG: hypothetical protein J07HQW1_02201 [Haloquadratum walsbyi J07HQW1]|uniref:Glycosyltransferase 2-like domain-containing protein n=1 Tax=Haloquadratum walsbyi J07HQW1 TaxID=1238424 RepID=U1PJ00_9EURY|nr:MAG: hypothetical protein J07HQW1_02201 [Haloquadratum walsbyi J07HQW1]